jgi:predicted RNA-binding protein YlxR (DUF448 family)
MIRLTVNFSNGEVRLNDSERKSGKPEAQGRSAYVCRSIDCLNNALKGTRLKFALEGRKGKGSHGRRIINWPLEAQLIKNLFGLCAEP